MIKLAYNKVKPNLVFEIDSIERYGLGTAGVIEKYVGKLTDTSTTPDTTIEGYKVQVAGFDAEWNEVPVDLGSTGDLNNQSKSATPSKSQQTIKPDAGYTGLDKVTIAATPLDATKTAELSTDADTTVTPSSGKLGIESVTVPRVTAAVDANIVAGNIKKDVNILGVTGTFEGGVQMVEDISAYADDSWNADRLFFKKGNFTITDSDLSDYFENLSGGSGASAPNPVTLMTTGGAGSIQHINAEISPTDDSIILAIVRYDVTHDVKDPLYNCIITKSGNTLSYSNCDTVADSAYSSGILCLDSGTLAKIYIHAHPYIGTVTQDYEIAMLALPVFEALRNDLHMND